MTKKEIFFVIFIIVKVVGSDINKAEEKLRFLGEHFTLLIFLLIGLEENLKILNLGQKIMLDVRHKFL